ncbi:MAG: hypothetical protein AAGA66_01670 [Bacteroidota bacterium]
MNIISQNGFFSCLLFPFRFIRGLLFAEQKGGHKIINNLSFSTTLRFVQHWLFYKHVMRVMCLLMVLFASYEGAAQRSEFEGGLDVGHDGAHSPRDWQRRAYVHVNKDGTNRGSGIAMRTHTHTWSMVNRKSEFLGFYFNGSEKASLSNSGKLSLQNGLDASWVTSRGNVTATNDFLTGRDIQVNPNRKIVKRGASNGFLAFQGFNKYHFDAPLRNNGSNALIVDDRFEVRLSNVKAFGADASNLFFNKIISNDLPNGKVIVKDAQGLELESNANVKIAINPSNGILIKGTTSIDGNVKVSDLSLIGNKLSSANTGTDKRLKLEDDDGILLKASNGGITFSTGTAVTISDRLFVNGEVQSSNSTGIVVNDQLSIKTGDLTVSTKIITKDLDVAPNKVNWPDYVFAEDYELRSLDEVQAYIQKEKHLPEIPSAQEVAQEGYNLPEMNASIIKKIEELTLYVLDLKRQNEALQQEVKRLNEQVSN